MLCADAGHEYPLICTKEDCDLYQTEHYPLLATLEGNEYRNEAFTLQHGDVLFVYTDGITDAKNKAQERFGIDRLLATVKEAKEDTPEKLVKAVKDTVEDFMDGSDAFDDITMMCIKYN